MTDLSVVVCVALDHRADTDGLRQFKKCIMECDTVEAVMECSGTFDLIIQARCESFADYTERMDSIADQVRLYASRIEANFVSKTLNCGCSPDDTRVMWVPCEGGKKSIQISKIDKVLAEGDYMSVHVGSWHCLVHDTMHHLCESLGDHFILLHRSALVRTDFIERALHFDRRWIVRLCDGTQQRVAKSHVADIIRLMSGESSNGGASKSKNALSREKSEPIGELKMHSER